jgi:hypothetical protein
LDGALLTRRIIEFSPEALTAPSDVHAEARARFEEIADGLEGIPPISVFWESVRVSRLCLMVRGWAFYYTLDGPTLRVIEVRKK